jgi:phosphopantothenoylcysteine synthetase/decarboxylase
MLEPDELLQEVVKLFQPKVLQGKHVLVSAGPTFEAIDPVRGITNLSSGKMGFALARAAAEAGGQVTLVAGPVHLPTPRGVRRIDVQSAQQMHDAVLPLAARRSRARLDPSLREGPLLWVEPTRPSTARVRGPHHRASLAAPCLVTYLDVRSLTPRVG